MNSSVGTSSDDQWMQFYEQTVVDGTIVTTSTPQASSETNLGELTPKGSSSKPIRRRLRASKKKPTTLFNTDATNFRALVQQFTGCPTTSLLNNRRGPINLNFALGTEHNRGCGNTTSVTPAGGHHGYYYQQSHQENASYQQQHHQQHAVSFDNVDPNALFSGSSSGRVNADDPNLDEFDLDNLSLQAFNRDFPYSNENANDGNYF